MKSQSKVEIAPLGLLAPPQAGQREFARLFKAAVAVGELATARAVRYVGLSLRGRVKRAILSDPLHRSPGRGPHRRVPQPKHGSRNAPRNHHTPDGSTSPRNSVPVPLETTPAT